MPHFGLPIFRENEVLFKKSSASERDLQRIALLIAKQLSEFVSFIRKLKIKTCKSLAFFQKLSGSETSLHSLGGMNFGYKKLLVIMLNIGLLKKLIQIGIL